MININKFKCRSISFILSTALLGSTIVSCSNNIKDKLSRDNINIEVIKEYNDNNIYKLDSFNYEVIDKLDKTDFIINNIPDVNYSIICTPNSFSKYTNEYNITYDDIRNTIDTIDVDSNIKDILLRGINNLESNNFSMNLAVLNYNLKQLKIVYSDSYELSQAVAKYEVKDSTVYLNCKDVNHGMTSAYIKDKDVFCCNSIPVCIIEDNKYRGNYVLGRAFDEALAEIIRKNASNRKIDNEDTFYSPCIYSLLLLLQSNNITINEYANNGVEYLIDRLKNNNLDSQISFIKKLDKKLLYLSFYDTDTEYTLEELIQGYIYDLIDNNINNGSNVKDINNNLNSIINSYKNYVIPYNIDDKNILSMINSNSGDYIILEDIEYSKNEYLKQYRALK